MITVGDHNTGIICPDWDHHRFGIIERVYFATIHHCFNFQETEQYLVLSLQYNMIRGSNSLLFIV